MPIGVSANQSLNFLPSTITVVIGVNNTIIWTNQDVTPHTVTTLPGSTLPSGASSFDSSTLSQGQTFRLTLSIPGTYQYHCSIHPAWMKSTIIVKAAATGY
jgi:plastocyanin